MRVVEVDERDSGWEDGDPRFRVYLFGADGPGHTVWTYDVSDADFLEAARWAQSEVGADRAFAIALVRDDRALGRGLVWLVGMDANDSRASGRQVERIAAMWRRRGSDIVVTGDV